MDNKIPHQSEDWIRDDKAGRPQRPSEVFLELWQAVTSLDCELPAEDFVRYAQSWRQIVSLEEIYAEAKRRERTLEKFASWSKEPAGAAEDTSSAPAGHLPLGGEGFEILRCAQDDREVAQGDRDGGPAGDDGTPHPSAAPTPSAPLSVGCADISPRRGESSPQGEDLTFDCASAPMPDPEEVTRANRSAGGKAGFATRKRNLTERLESLRRDGHKLHEIAEAVPGLTINDVMDGLNAKTLTPMKIQALERACKKLEEAQAGG